MLIYFQELEEYYLTTKSNLFLKVENLTKCYGKKEVVNLNFGLSEGICLGIIGPNGAGKTTTLNLILSLIKKNSGNLEINLNNFENEFRRTGSNFNELIVEEKNQEIKNTKLKNFSNEKCGICFQIDSLWSELTVNDHIKFFMELYNLKNTNHIKRLLKYFEIDYLIEREIYKLSTGERKKLLMVLNLIDSSKYFFLDETSANLDPDSREDLRKILNKLKINYKCTIITTTHFIKGKIN